MQKFILSFDIQTKRNLPPKSNITSHSITKEIEDILLKISNNCVSKPVNNVYIFWSILPKDQIVNKIKSTNFDINMDTLLIISLDDSRIYSYEGVNAGELGIKIDEVKFLLEFLSV